ncbi:MULTISPECIES: nuclear transport factor 2 family protein [Streptomyces]|uniref:Nuclear transport factor 2 family protein n=1 Tax=Streptomyces ardesiacus TaxID=285564 RepID=A0ABW8HIZ4_9ACTN|nr:MULTISPECIES: nuclear transport factor 2 family protein [Streptomyces]MBQ0911441.1 nuclear transport factor 2 family protein [Streptomyces sp. RM99]MBQ1097955.1 nuclear transport factor 2 family protein [Streptomyces sp. b94]MCC8340453.1 nuclear transport factor 2 family protein [Streptomyces sp. R1]QIP73536.1 nuclear transport factor 2 family protein [Streptomyces sp. VN1]WQC17130.1 nuclear transport factor 2 family protein [Streptomyces rochei]
MTTTLAEQAVTDFVREWSTAEERGEHRALDDLLAKDFVGVGPRGFVRSREEWLARYSTGTVRNTSFEVSDLRIRSYGETAVVVAAQTQQSVNGDADASGAFRFTLIVVRQDGRLRLAGLHLSPNAVPAGG